MGLLRWLFKICFDYEEPEPLPVRRLREETIEALRDGPVDKRDLLERSVREFRWTCGRWKSGTLSTPEAHESFARIRKRVSVKCLPRSHVESTPDGARALRFSKLLAEMKMATELEPRDRTIADDAVELSDQLGEASFTSLPAWERIAARRGGLMGFRLYRCNDCGKRWPFATGWALQPNEQMFVLFSDRTGDIRLMSSLDGTAQLIGCTQPGPQREAAINASNYRFPRCPEGGQLRTALSDACPWCNSGNIERQPMTAFKYLEEHKLDEVHSFTR